MANKMKKKDIKKNAVRVMAIILAALFEKIKGWLFSCAEKQLRNRIKGNEDKK